MKPAQNLSTLSLRRDFRWGRGACRAESCEKEKARKELPRHVGCGFGGKVLAGIKI